MTNETRLDALADACEASVHVTCNEHLAAEMSPAEYLASVGFDDPGDACGFDASSALLLEIQWYPHTPIGFCRAYGSEQLAPLLTHALECMGLPPTQATIEEARIEALARSGAWLSIDVNNHLGYYETEGPRFTGHMSPHRRAFTAETLADLLTSLENA